MDTNQDGCPPHGGITGVNNSPFGHETRLAKSVQTNLRTITHDISGNFHWLG